MSRKRTAANTKSALKYFERNREALIQRRRERMADPEFREVQREYSRKFQKKLATGHVPSKFPPLFTTLNGERVRVYRNSEAARMVGCSPAAILKWIREGWIPHAPIQGRRRVFLDHQIEFIKLFYSVPFWDWDNRSQCSKFIFENWTDYLTNDYKANIGGCKLELSSSGSSG